MGAGALDILREVAAFAKDGLLHSRRLFIRVRPPNALLQYNKTVEQYLMEKTCSLITKNSVFTQKSFREGYVFPCVLVITPSPHCETLFVERQCKTLYPLPLRPGHDKICMHTYQTLL
jgi:hypothetical protein